MRTNYTRPILLPSSVRSIGEIPAECRALYAERGDGWELRPEALPGAPAPAASPVPVPAPAASPAAPAPWQSSDPVEQLARHYRTRSTAEIQAAADSRRARQASEMADSISDAMDDERKRR